MLVYSAKNAVSAARTSQQQQANKLHTLLHQSHEKGGCSWPSDNKTSWAKNADFFRGALYDNAEALKKAVQK